MRGGGGARTRGVAILRLLAVAGAVATLAAGCGDDTSSAEEWADGVCSAFSDWRDDVTTAGEELRAGPTTRDDLKSTADDLEEATDNFLDDIRDLDDLETEGGQEAKATLDRLAEDVDQNKENIQSTVSGTSGVQDVVQPCRRSQARSR